MSSGHHWLQFGKAQIVTKIDSRIKLFICAKTIVMGFFTKTSSIRILTHHLIFWPHLSHLFGWSLTSSFDLEEPASVFLTSVPTSLGLSFLASIGFWASSFLFRGEDDDLRIRAGLLRGAGGRRIGLLEGLLLLVLMCLSLIFLLAINLSLHDLSSVKLIPTLDPSQTPLRLS